MTDPRRYTEDEIAEMLKLATTDDGGVQPGSRGSGEGLTLEQIQEIGSEVGIAPARIADAARAMASRDLVGPTKTFLGAPRSVSRIVPIDRALTDDEWARLVVDLRETFDAVGQVSTQGDLRLWRNGNLQVHVEPDGNGYRVRMRTVKGNVSQAVVMSAGFLFMSVVMALLILSGEGNFRGLILAAMFGAAGVGTLAYSRATLPGWALERAAQMEGLAERIPLLLEE